MVFHSKLSVYQRVISISSSINRRKFRSQTSDNMDIWKAEQARGREKRKIRKEKIREEKDQKREDQRRERVRRNRMQMRKKVRKSRNTLFFQWFVAPEGRKVGSLKRRVRSQLARWEMSKKCTPLWREAHFQVKMYKNTPFSDHFWKLRCRKSARRCGAKHISKSKVLKTGGLGPLLEVQMSKKCTPLWREAHFQVTLHYATLHHTPLYYTTLHYTTQHDNYNYTTRLHSTTLHYIKFHYTTLHYTTLHYTTLH